MASPNETAIRSVPWGIGSAFMVFLLPWVILPIAVIIGLQLIVPYLPSLAPFVHALGEGEPKASFALVAVDAIGSFGLIGYYLHKYRRGLGALGYRRFSLGKMLLYLLLLVLSFGLLVAAADAIVQALYPGFNPDQAQTNEFTQHKTTLSLWALVIIPPFIEETVFRGYMFPAFAKRYGLAGGAIISSFLFAFAHLQLNVSVYTFVLGLLLCFLYTRLGSIIPGIALHMLNNYVAYIALQQK